MDDVLVASSPCFAGPERRGRADDSVILRFVDVLADLAAEEEAIEAILSGFTDAQWAAPSAAQGWTVADVVLHLAQTEEAVAASLAGERFEWRGEGESLDAAMARLVREQSGAADATFARWKAARRAALIALRDADPARVVQWAAAPLRPRTLATARLAEHWAHALDITTPFGIDYPDTDRLRHIAWLAHASLPYAFAIAEQPPADVFCELTAPSGEIWRFGPEGADSTISGSASAFCRVGAQRLAPDESGLVTTGPHGARALSALRSYAV